jgi:hypothetical protein|tara:strand:+ start:2433 stop:3503 length:1071 start_codon:yes stop_codon:yes gene_type:complete
MAPARIPPAPVHDQLDHAVAFLKTRDGLDKSLKLMRYAAMFCALGVNPLGVAGSKLRDLDASTAVARKFLRLGKFLGNAKDVKTLLKEKENLAGDAMSVKKRVSAIDNSDTDSDLDASQSLAIKLNQLALGSAGASFAYYLTEQFVWGGKVGLIRNSKTKKRIGSFANLFEMAIYVFSLQLAWVELRNCNAELAAAEMVLKEHKKNDDDINEDDNEDDNENNDDDDDEDEASNVSRMPFLRRSLAADSERTLRASTTGSPLKNASQRAVRFLKRIGRFEMRPTVSEEDLVENVLRARRKQTLAAVVFAADVADASACVSEITGGTRNPLRKPKLVAGLGVVSALCGVYEKWVGTKV